MTSPDLTVALIKMVLSLAFILALLWAAHRWLSRALPSSRTNAKGRLIKVLASNQLGMKKSIAVVQVPGSVLVLGVGTEQINLLKSIDDPDIIAGLNLEEANTKTAVSFSDQLQRLTRNFKGNKNNIENSDNRGGPE